MVVDCCASGCFGCICKLQHHANASKAAACATVNHHQNTPQSQTKTQRHTTHEKCLTSLSEALKEEVTPPRQRPGEMPPDASQAAASASTPPSEQASKPRKCIQSSRLRNSKPPSEHAPKPDKNAAPHHPRKVPNVAFWSPKRRSYLFYYYTAKATTRLHLEKMGPDASASNVAASATANHPRNKLQHHANASKAAACATVNHHQNTPQNQTKTQRHTTHENCLTSLSEALKEEVITPPRQRPDCIWTRWVQMHLHPM